MGKKKSSPKIDPAYYAIGAIVLGIVGYYYYIKFYVNGIDLSIYGYTLVNASSNVAPPLFIEPKPSPGSSPGAIKPKPYPNPPKPFPNPPKPSPPKPDPAPPASVPGPSPATITPPEEAHPTMPLIPPFGIPSTVTSGSAPAPGGGDPPHPPPPPPQAVPQLKQCTDIKCDSNQKHVPDAGNKNGRSKEDCCVRKVCSDINCDNEYLRIRDATKKFYVPGRCCIKMNVSHGWHRIPHVYYDDHTTNLFQSVPTSEECSRKCHSKGNYVFTWNINNNTCYCKSEMKHAKNSGGQDGKYVSGRFGTGGKMCEHRDLGGKCQTFPVGQYTMHHEKMKGVAGECETKPVAGRTVALYSDHWKRFVNVTGRRVTMSPTVQSVSLPSSWDSERFELVPAQDGQFAFYNHKHRNYLRMPGRDKDMDGSDRINKHSSIPHNQMGWERFYIEDRGGGNYTIRCPYSVGGSSYMRAGGHHVNGVAHRGPWETFRIVDVNCRPGFNDTFSSAMTYPGYVLEMYADDNFSGKHWAIAGTANELGDHADRTSSVKVRWRGH